jgi:hypothetical protein
VITQVVVSTARSSGTLVTGSVMLALVAMTAVHPAHAVTPSSLWEIGRCKMQLTVVMALAANTKLQPLNPSESFLAESSGFGIFTFGPPQSIAANGTITGSVTRILQRSISTSLHRQRLRVSCRHRARSRT